MTNAYTWSFAQSFLVFLCIVFISESVSLRLKHMVPMPLLFGVLFSAGFASGILPKDLILSSNMVTVGTIAFNVLVIHSGTMIDLRSLLKRKKELLMILASVAVLTAVSLPVLHLLIGRDLAMLSPGAVIGGGATCAIGSRWVSSVRPEISFFPWLIFMLQGIFSVPVVKWALKKESARILSECSGAHVSPPPKPPVPATPVSKLPEKYKTPAYYLGTIMFLAVLNYALQAVLPSAVNPNITALLIGIAASNAGLIDRAPLFRSDSYGLLILSLMGLMANNLASTPVRVLLSLTVPALAALAVGSAVLTACGWFLAKPAGISPYAGIAMMMNSVMGFPVNRELADEIAQRAPEQTREMIRGRVLSCIGPGTALVSNGISIILISIFAALI